MTKNHSSASAHSGPAAIDPEYTKVPLKQLLLTPWVPVISMTLATPPANPTEGDTYLVPDGATGWWADYTGQIAQWYNNEWSFSIPVDGHGISLPDGRIFERVGGVYIEKIAIDVQSGKWVYAEDTSTTVNSVVVNPVPAVAALTAGLALRIKAKNSNTGKTQITIGNLPATDLVRLDGSSLFDSDLVAGGIHEVVYDGAKFQLQNTFTAPQLRRPIDLYVNAAVGNDGNDGTANDADHALKSIQAAVDRAFLYGPSPYLITIHVADGNYGAVQIPSGPTRSGPALSIIGNMTTPSSVVVDGASGNAFLVFGPNVVSVSGIRTQNDPSGTGLAGFIASTQSWLNVAQCETGDIGGSALQSFNGGVLHVANHRFAGNSQIMFLANLGGHLNISGTQTIAKTIELIACAVANIGIITVSSSAGAFVTPENVTAGKRFNVASNGVINSGGRGPDFFPGTLPGTTDTGGQYV